MAKNRKPANPFYVLLVVVGVAFTITACAYGVMTVKRIRPMAVEQPDSPMLDFLDENGLTIMVGELVVLGIATFAAIGTDEYWYRRNEKVSKD